MPVYYNISPELKIVYIICAGLATAQELFEAVDLSSLDSRRKPGMDTVIDIMSGNLDFELADMYKGVGYLNRLHDEGAGLERQMLVTPSKSLHLLVDAIHLMPAKNILKLKAVSTLQDAIFSLQLSDHLQEAIRFFDESKDSIRKP